MQEEQKNENSSENSEDKVNYVNNEENLNENASEVENTDEAADNQEINDKIVSEGSESEILGLNKKVKAAEELADQYKDKYVRSVAEFDNYRKRTQREKEALYTDVKTDVVKEMLPVLDNLERAYDSIKATADESVLKGIDMVIKQFSETFKSLNVEKIEALHAEFDPNLHNAVMHVEDESVEGTNIIVEELQKGYKIGDKVIRPSMVKVAN